MTEGIMTALIGLAGSAFGAFVGVIVNSKLTIYRLEQLEKKVDKHNNFAGRIPVIEERIEMQNHRISDLEKERKL